MEGVSGRIPGQAGVTLVEVMVSAVILGLSIAATATMLGTGLNLEHERNVERQAYILAHGLLELPEYTYPANYESIPPLDDTVWINTASRPLNVALSVRVQPEENENWPPYHSTFRKRVDAVVRWTQDGVADSVKVTKVVARVE